MNELPITGSTPVGGTANGNFADWAGMVASIGCAIHCAAMPLVLAYLPALGLSWLADEGFHKWMAAICFGLAAAAFVPGWRKHRSFLPAMWGIAGVLLLTTAAFGMEGSCCPSCSTEQPAIEMPTACSDATCTLCQATIETPQSESQLSSSIAWIAPFVTPLGGLLLVIGHVANRLNACACQGDHCCVSSGGSET